MSDVDKRVVKFEFDNRKFEQNVKQSMSTLDKLKRNLDFSGVSDNLDKVSVKISALEVAAITAIANISNRLVDIGVRLVKSLSIDNISAGWTKFGEKTISVGTMAAQAIKVAGKSIEDYGEKLEAIDEQLEKLNWFTDETSYNFADMVNTIGQFTAAGQDLDKSVNAIMGIANWAAKSGKNAQTASHAMFQLAQAMGRGYIMGQDWMSIQTAGMATAEFKQRVLDSAVAMKELTKVGNEYVTKTGKKISATNFDLSSRWFTTDILVAALGDYSAAVEDIYKISKEEGLTATDVLEKYSDSFDEFGLAAFKAAQEARTFNDVIGAIKDAVSTGWMSTAENIFGSYDEAKVLWTDLANELYDVFVEGGNFRNEVLNTWNSLAGRADLFKHGGEDQGAFWNIYDSIVAVINLVKESFNDIFPKSLFSSYAEQVKDVANRFKQYTKRLQENTKRIADALKNSERLRNIFRGLFSVLQVGVTIIKAIRYAIDPIITVAVRLGDRLLTLASDIGLSLQNNEGVISKIVEIAQKLAEVLIKIIDFINPVGLLDNILYYLGKVINVFGTFVTKAVGYTKTFIGFVANGFSTFIQKIKDSEIISKILNGVTNAFKKLKEVIRTLFGKKADKTSASNNPRSTSSILGRTGAFLDPRSIANVKEDLEEDVKELTPIQKLLQSLLSLWNAIKKLVSSLTNVVASVISIVSGLISGIADFINGFAVWDNEKFRTYAKVVLIIVIVGTILSKIGVALYDLLYIVRSIKTPLIALSGVFDSLSGLLDSLGRKMFMTGIANIIKSIGISMLSISASLMIFEQVKSGWWKGAIVLASLLATIIALAKICKPIVNELGLFRKGLTGAAKETAKVGAKIKNFQTTLKFHTNPLMSLARVIKNIGLSMLAISAAMLILQSISQEGFDRGIKVLAGMLVFITSLSLVAGLISIFGKGDITLNLTKAIPNIFSMVGLVLAVNAVARSLERLTKYDWKSLGLPILGVMGVMFSVSLLAFVIGKFDKDTKSMAKNLASVALIMVSLYSVAQSINILSSIEWNNAKNALLAIIAYFAEMVLFTLALGVLNKSLIKDSANFHKTLLAISALNMSLIGIAGSIYLLTSTVNKFGSENAWTALGMIAALLAAYGAMCLLIGTTMDSGDTITAAMQSIGKIASTMLVLSGVVFILSKIDIKKDAIKTMGFFAALFAGYAIMVKKIGNINQEGLKSVTRCIWLLQLVMVDVALLVGAIYLLQKVNWTTIASLLGGISVFLLSIAGAIIILSKAKLNIAKVKNVILSMGGLMSMMATLALSIRLLADVPWQNILTAAGAMSACMAVLVSLTLILSKVKTNIKQALKTLAMMGTLVLTLYSISWILPKIADGLKSLTDIDWSVIGKAGAILGGLVAIILILSTLGAAFPPILIAMGVVAGVFLAISLSISLVVESFAHLVQAVTNFLRVINNMNGQVREIVTNALMGISLAIIDSAPAIKEAIVTLLTVLVSALCEALLANQVTIMTTLYTMLINVLDGFVTYGPIIAEYLLQIFDILTEYIPQFIDKLWTLVGKVLSTLWNKIKSIPLVSKILDFLAPVWEGIKKAWDVIKKVFDDIRKVLDPLFNWFSKKIWEPLKKMWNGIKTAWNWVKTNIIDKVGGWFAELASSVKDGFEKMLGINSPSKVFEQEGEYIVAGLANGLNNSTSEATNAMNNVISAISDSMNDGIDDEVVITPVVDLSKVSEGTRNINSMMDSINGSRLSVSARLANSVSGNMNRNTPLENQNGVVNNNNNQTENYYNTFNITSDDPEEVARQTDMLLQRNRLRANLAKGGA